MEVLDISGTVSETGSRPWGCHLESSPTGSSSSVAKSSLCIEVKEIELKAERERDKNKNKFGKRAEGERCFAAERSCKLTIVKLCLTETGQSESNLLSKSFQCKPPYSTTERLSVIASRESHLFRISGCVLEIM